MALAWSATAEIVRATPPFAETVPADVGLFVELQNSEDLLIALTEPQLWLALAEVAGQPAEAEDAAHWRAQVRQVTGMDPEEAIRRLFAGGVAFVGEGVLRSQGAVVLCRPAESIAIDDLLERWEAEPSPDGANVYRLRTQVGLGRHAGGLVFGEPAHPSHLFRRVMAINPGSENSLADSPAFRALLARVPPRPDGLLYARLSAARTPVLLPPAPTTEPTMRPVTSPVEAEVARTILPRLAGPLRGAEHALVALHRDGGLLRFNAVSDARLARPATRDGLMRLVGQLPEQTLAAWSGHIGYGALVAAFESLPPQHIARVVVRGLGAEAGALDEILASPSAVAIGAVEQVTAESTPPLPVAAVILSVREPARAKALVDELIKAATSVYNLISLRQGRSLIPPQETVRWPEGREIRRLDLSGLVRGPSGGVVSELELCWVVDGDRLVIATHTDWLRTVLASRQATGPTLAEVIDLQRLCALDQVEQVSVARFKAATDVGRAWRRFLRREAPEAFDENWWRSRQPHGGRVQLGVNVRPVADRPALEVTSVRENAPASGLLAPGDLLIGVGGRRYTSDDVLAEMRAAIVERPHPGRLEVLIERDGGEQVIRVPLPFVNPVELLERFIGVGNVIAHAVYADTLIDPQGPRGVLTIELSERVAAAPVAGQSNRSTTTQVAAPSPAERAGDAGD